MTTTRLSRRTDPITSVEAAELVEGNGRRDSNKKRLLTIVTEKPDQTAGEYARDTGIDRVEVGRRLPDLMHDGWIEQSTPRRCTAKGTRMMTWRPASEAEERQTELF